jgi:hypothetical protein
VVGVGVAIYVNCEFDAFAACIPFVYMCERCYVYFKFVMEERERERERYHMPIFTAAKKCTCSFKNAIMFIGKCNKVITLSFHACCIDG